MKITQKRALSFAWARTTAISIGIVVSATASGQTFDPLAPPVLTELEQLGKHVFFDTDLSKPKKQGCVSCHDPAAGWTFPDSDINEGQVVAPGAIWHRSGGIKTPGNSYASFAPVFKPCLDAFGENRGNPNGGRYCGGMFWDGRAEGYGKREVPQSGIPFGDQGTVSATITPEDLPGSVRVAYSEFLGPVADQALNPFPNSVEQNIDPKIVCKRVALSDYSDLYREAFGEKINCKTKPKSNPAYLTSFKRLAVALSAYQASADVNSFTSKRDIALRKELACAEPNGRFADFYNWTWCSDPEQAEAKGDSAWGEFPLADLTVPENRGHDLFYGIETASNAPEEILDEEGNGTGVFSTTNAGCHRCHNDNPLVDDGTEPFQTYNDFAYHNIGIPFNREIPGVVPGQINGSISHVSTRADNGNPVRAGFFKNPTARNVAKGEGEITKAYGHNGYFKSLKGIVHFYSTRDLKPDCDADDRTNPLTSEVMPGVNLGIEHPTEAEALAAGCWPEAEFTTGAGPTGFSFGNVGRLNLTEEQEDALVVYLEALADQYTPTAP